MELHIHVAVETEPQSCQSVIHNFNKRVDICGIARSGHQNENLINRISIKNWSQSNKCVLLKILNL